MTRPKGKLSTLVRLLKWMLGWLLAGRPARKALRKASRLEQDGMFPDAHREVLRAWRLLHRPHLDYWNPLLFELRMDVTLSLDKMAAATGGPLPREQIEEVVEAFRVVEESGGYPLHKDLANVVAQLKSRLNKEPSRPQ
jgi:hypothetical protein